MLERGGSFEHKNRLKTKSKTITTATTRCRNEIGLEAGRKITFSLQLSRSLSFLPSLSLTRLFISLFYFLVSLSLVIFPLLLSCPLYFIFLVCFSFSYLSLSLTGLFLSLTCLFVSFLSLYLSFIFHAFLAFIFLLSAHLRSPCHNSPRVRSIPLCLYLFT